MEGDEKETIGTTVTPHAESTEVHVEAPTPGAAEHTVHDRTDEVLEAIKGVHGRLDEHGDRLKEHGDKLETLSTRIPEKAIVETPAADSAVAGADEGVNVVVDKAKDAETKAADITVVKKKKGGLRRKW